MSSAQINMCYIIYFVFILHCIVFYDVILVYSVGSIVLRVRNKGDDDTEAAGMYTGSGLETNDRPLARGELHSVRASGSSDLTSPVGEWIFYGDLSTIL